MSYTSIWNRIRTSNFKTFNLATTLTYHLWLKPASWFWLVLCKPLHRPWFSGILVRKRRTFRLFIRLSWRSWRTSCGTSTIPRSSCSVTTLRPSPGWPSSSACRSTTRSWNAPSRFSWGSLLSWRTSCAFWELFCEYCSLLLALRQTQWGQTNIECTISSYCFLSQVRKVQVVRIGSIQPSFIWVSYEKPISSYCVIIMVYFWWGCREIDHSWEWNGWTQDAHTIQLGATFTCVWRCYWSQVAVIYPEW